jgi:competence protein ComEA
VSSALRAILTAGTMLSLLLSLLAPRPARAEGKDLDGVVNLNTAGAELLELLPGIGPAKVRSIVSYRQRHPFRTVDELVRIKGIGRKMVRRLRVHLAVSGPTTARALHHPRGADPPPPPPRKPAGPMPPSKAAAGPPPLAARRGAVAPVARVRPRVSSRGDRDRAVANHCARPP